jgi:hypothetical protein
MVGDRINSLRTSRSEMEWLAAALLISLIVHLGAWSGYELGKKFGWWEKLPFARHQTANKKNPPPLQVAQTTEPTIFVEVTHPENEPPKNTRYYSDKNSRAANPDSEKDSNQPKINGKQKNVPKMEDVPRLPNLQPSPPEEKSEPSPAAEAQPPASPMNIGDLQLAKTENPSTTEPNSQPHPRARTLKEAQAQQPTKELPGPKLQQDGGTKRHAVWSSLDAKATPFGAYDRAIVEAVTQRWYDLLDSRQFAQDRSGRVILKFKLKFDGTITEMETLENTVGELLGYVCQEAIQDAAPFAPWPPDMRREIGENYREITFTFYYY